MATVLADLKGNPIGRTPVCGKDYMAELDSRRQTQYKGSGRLHEHKASFNYLEIISTPLISDFIQNSPPLNAAYGNQQLSYSNRFIR
jgi:hypothetical protein